MAKPQAALSRPTSMPINGKQTATVKTLVSDDFKDTLTQFWKKRGYGSESDFVRELLIVTVHGPQYLTDLHRQRIEALVRSVDGIGTGAAR